MEKKQILEEILLNNAQSLFQKYKTVQESQTSQDRRKKEKERKPQLHNFNYMIFYNRQNCGDSKRISCSLVLREGRDKQAEQRGF